MQSTEFGAEDWIERLARALGKLSAGQERYLQEYYRQHPRVHDVSEEPGNKHAGLPTRRRAATSMPWRTTAMSLREEEYYAPLSAVLDPARNILRSHPMLAAGHKPDYRLGRILPDGDPQYRAVDLVRGPDRGTDGPCGGTVRGSLPDGGGGTERAPRSGRRKKRVCRCAWGAGCRMRRGAVLRPDLEGKDRHCGRHGTSPV